MKPTGLNREATPLWVWLALALMVLAAGAYLTGYIVLEDILAHFAR